MVSKRGKICYLISGISLMVLVAARFMLGEWVDLLYFPLGLALISFFAAVVFDYKFYLEFLSMRTTKHGMNMGVLILLALVLAVAINFLGVRYDKTFDLTKEKINSLSDQSVSAVKNLSEDLKVLIFFKGKDLKEQAMQIRGDFHYYETVSPQVKVSTIDANREVEEAKRYLEHGEAFAVVVDYKGRRAVVQPSMGSPDRPVYQERDITSAIMKITRDKPMTIYFLTGHGEKDIDQASIDGIKTFAGLLRDDGYTVAKINLVTDTEPLEPSAVIAIVGPKTAYSDKELEQIRQFAKGGGRLFVAIDPGESHQLARLTKSFGIEFRNNYVLNEVRGTDEGIVGAVGMEFDKMSPVTKKFEPGRSLAVFPFASELVKAPDASSEFTYAEIVKSHPMAYAANSPNGQVKNPERKQHVLAMTAKKDKFSGVFFGDSDFLSDVRIGNWIHLDLAMNSIAHLFDDEMNITIRPKTLEATQLQITQTKGMALLLAGVSLPLCLIILSGLFWYRRRNL